MPEQLTVNPNLTVMMIGERCADLIRAGHTGGAEKLAAKLAEKKEEDLSPSFA